MTPEQKAAFIMSQAACALAEIEGMKAENALAAVLHRSPTYNELHFLAVIEHYALHHNAVVSFLSD